LPIAEDFARLLDLVQRPGDFYTQGNQEIAAPRLMVEGVGPIALPLLPVQAAQLIAAAERAPYGRGADGPFCGGKQQSADVWPCGPRGTRISPERVLLHRTWIKSISIRSGTG